MSGLLASGEQACVRSEQRCECEKGLPEASPETRLEFCIDPPTLEYSRLHLRRGVMDIRWADRSPGGDRAGGGQPWSGLQWGARVREGVRRGGTGREAATGQPPLLPQGTWGSRSATREVQRPQPRPEGACRELFPRNKTSTEAEENNQTAIGRVWRGLQEEGSVLKLARLEPACGLWSLLWAETAESWLMLFLAWPTGRSSPGPPWCDWPCSPARRLLRPSLSSWLGVIHVAGLVSGYSPLQNVCA